MTCAACHTGQLEYTRDGAMHSLRLDGAPANADFQQFLVDLLAASSTTLAEPDRFDTFSKAVLGDDRTAAEAAEIKGRFGEWVAQFQEFMDKSLPTQPWGPGRLDAFGMIFNRVTARDLGVVGNFKIADAPVSYPFLWNAGKQDRTQWNGGVENGLYFQALGRNSGEVFGVFAEFTPHRRARANLFPPAFIDYTDTSRDLAGLQTLEENITKLLPPAWPREIFGLDESQKALGARLFARHCTECHGETDSPELPGRWLTPVRAVGTDPKMVLNSRRMVDPGILAGASMPPPGIFNRIGNPAKAADVLGAAVVGSLMGEVIRLPFQSTEQHVQSASGRGRSRLRVEGVARHLGHCALSSQRIGAQPLGIAEAREGPHQSLHGRQSRLRPQECRL
jgi:hypothetical protein